MAKQIIVPPYRLPATHKRILIKVLTGKMTTVEGQRALGITRQKYYVMLAVILRHAVSTGKVDAKELLKEY